MRCLLIVTFALAILWASTGMAQVVRGRVVGSPGDHWLTDQQYLKIARETVDGTFGYAIDYNVPGCGELTLFWPRSQIHLNGNKAAPRWRRLAHRCESGRLYYPSHIAGRKSVHSTLHTDAYYKWVNKELEGVQTASQARARLEAMAAILRSPR